MRIDCITVHMIWIPRFESSFTTHLHAISPSPNVHERGDCRHTVAYWWSPSSNTLYQWIHAVPSFTFYSLSHTHTSTCDDYYYFQLLAIAMKVYFWVHALKEDPSYSPNHKAFNLRLLSSFLHKALCWGKRDANALGPVFSTLMLFWWLSLLPGA